jgi:hypothetical protein
MIHSNFLSHYNDNEESFFQFDANTASDKYNVYKILVLSIVSV